MRLSLLPLFFLPRAALLWAHNQAVSEGLMTTPFRWLSAKADNLGIWFAHKGDEVVWTWPWTRKDRVGDNRGRAPFISVGFSGTGEWGDARYWTLTDLDKDWAAYFKACEGAYAREVAEWDVTLNDGLIAAEDLQAGDLVALTDDGQHVRKAAQPDMSLTNEMVDAMAKPLADEMLADMERRALENLMEGLT